MFRHLSYCHVPSNLENRQLEQGRISGSFFGKSVFFFITHLAAMCWNPSDKYLGVLSQFVNCKHCVKGSFVIYFGVVKSHKYNLAVMLKFTTTFLFLILAEKVQLETQSHCCQDVR